MTIDPESFVPVYVQLADHLREQITSGRLTPGQALPTQLQLVQEHGVSRETVRSAFEELRKEGLIETRRPSGTYVRALVDDAEEVTLTPGARVTYRMPTTHERRRDGIPEGVPLLVVQDEHGEELGAYPADRTILRAPDPS